MVFERLKDASFWHSVKDDAKYAGLLAEVRRRWEDLRYVGEIPVLTYEARMLFYRTGDRKVFETPYFRRRNSLSLAAVR